MRPVDPKHVGYFTEAGQETPAFDPGRGAPCLVCGHAWEPENVRTVCLSPLEEGEELRTKNLSFFYRVHIECHEGLSEGEHCALESAILQTFNAWEERQ